MEIHPQERRWYFFFPFEFQESAKDYSKSFIVSMIFCKENNLLLLFFTATTIRKLLMQERRFSEWVFCRPVGEECACVFCNLHPQKVLLVRKTLRAGFVCEISPKMSFYIFTLLNPKQEHRKSFFVRSLTARRTKNLEKFPSSLLLTFKKGKGKMFPNYTT